MNYKIIETYKDNGYIAQTICTKVSAILGARIDLCGDTFYPENNSHVIALRLNDNIVEVNLVPYIPIDITDIAERLSNQSKKY